MKKQLLAILLSMFSIFLLTGCLGHQSQRSALQFTPQTVGNGQYVAKVNNAVIIQDASMTMAGTGLQASKNLLGSMNQSLPADLHLNMGLRSFGHSDQQSRNLTELVYGMTGYTRDGLQKGVDSVKVAGGNSPLGVALLAAGDDLKGAQGQSAIIVVSDGLQMDSAPAAAQQVKSALGDKVCIYTIAMGASAAGASLLEQVAKAGQCGFAENGAALTSASAMGAFVEKVFLTRAPKAAPAPPLLRRRWIAMVTG